ncbi:MAG: tetratricopeptide repeat protein [Rhizomicrobium sp.]
MVSHRPSVLSVGLLLALMGAASALPRKPKAEDPAERYQTCLSLANLNPVKALAEATQWGRNKGGAPAEHCAALALVQLKRYPEAASKLDALGRAPDMGRLRSLIFDQAGNAWMLAGNAARAVASFEAALALSANDADLFADLARAEAMRKAFGEAEADLNAALALAPRRADLLVLRASARDAQRKWKDARVDADSALALTPSSPEALVERGEIERHAGDLVAARRDFGKVLTLTRTGESAEAAHEGLEDLGP